VFITASSTVAKREQPHEVAKERWKQNEGIPYRGKLLSLKKRIKFRPALIWMNLESIHNVQPQKLTE
jgi:hypothetical protein